MNLSKSELNEWALKQWASRSSGGVLGEVLSMDGYKPAQGTDFCSDLNAAYKLVKMILPVNIGVRLEFFTPISSGGISGASYEFSEGATRKWASNESLLVGCNGDDCVEPAEALVRAAYFCIKTIDDPAIPRQKGSWIVEENVVKRRYE